MAKYRVFGHPTNVVKQGRAHLKYQWNLWEPTGSKRIIRN
jgi:hypothetical protein